MHINRGGTNLGTFSEEEVRSGLRAGRFVGTDLGWREGMPAWKPLSQFAEFAADLAAAASPPVPPPPAGGDVPPAPGSTVPAPVTLPAAPPTALGVAPGMGLPWDRRHEIGLFRAFIETLQMVLGRPTDAFTAMKREGGLGGPLLYAVIGGTIGTVVSFIYRFGLHVAEAGSFDHGSYRFLGAAGLLGLIVCSPLIVIIVLFISSALIHVCLLIVGGARHTFETTFRVICFAAGSVNPLQIVPLCGGLVAGIWGLVLYCIGLARAHETEPGRAVLAVFLPLVLCCGGTILLIIMAGGAAVLTHALR